jgi:hypothetical protein
MLDKPDSAELLEAVAAFLDNDVVPAFEGRKRFHALVAANVVRIVARDARQGAGLLENEIDELWILLERPGKPAACGDRRALALELSAELCRKIDGGEADEEPRRSAVAAYLERQIARRLEIDNPKLVK